MQPISCTHSIVWSQVERFASGFSLRNTGEVRIKERGGGKEGEVREREREREGGGDIIQNPLFYVMFSTLSSAKLSWGQDNC